MSALNAQLGSAEETVFGVPVPVTHFDEFNSESIKATYGRVEYSGLRAGRLYRSADRFTTYPKGAAGDIKLEVGSKGFGFWLRQMLGGVPVTTGTATGFTHTFTPALLTGRSFTTQVGRPFYVGSPVQAFTYSGGKVASWELTNSTDDNLVAKLSCDFAAESTAVALAAAAYATDLQTFNWVGGSCTVGGTAFDVSEVSVSGDNGLKTDRRYLRNNPQKKEQVGDDYRSGEFSLTADFDGLAMRDRVAAATAAGATAQVVLKWEAPGPIAGGSIKPALVVTVNGRFDEWEATVGGPESIEQQISGVYLGTNGLQVAYTTADATTTV